MNKKLIVAAMAATMAAPAAFADVTVYGKLHMSVDSVDLDNGTFKGQTVTSRASRIGFKGTEDLGNGLKAIWKAEFEMEMDNKSALTNGRDTYVGLAGNFGSVLLGGRINTPMKNSTGKMDFFSDTLADYNATIGIQDERATNAIVYVSPKFSGLQFSAATMAGETTANDSLTNGYSLAATYNNAGIMAAVAYEDLSDLGKTGEKLRVGLGYKMDAFKVAAVYEDQTDVNGAVGEDATLIQVQGAYTMGNNTVMAMWGQNDPSNGFTTKKSWAVGVNHKMSKRTKVYAVYTDSGRALMNYSSSVYKGAAGEGFSLGMVHSF